VRYPPQARTSPTSSATGRGLYPKLDLSLSYPPRLPRGGAPVYSSVWDVVADGTPVLAYDTNIEGLRTVAGGVLTNISPYLGGGVDDEMVEFDGPGPAFTASDPLCGGLSTCARVAGVGYLRSLTPASATMALQPYTIVCIGVPPGTNSTPWIFTAVSTAGQIANVKRESTATYFMAAITNANTAISCSGAQGAVGRFTFTGAASDASVRRADGTNATSGAISPGTNSWRGFTLFRHPTTGSTGNAKLMAWSMWEDFSAADWTAVKGWCQTNMVWL